MSRLHTPAVVLCCALLLAAPPVTGKDDDLPRQRQDFLAAERLIDQGRHRQARELMDKLGDYPLLPYLHYADLRRRLDSADAAEVRAFLARYDAVPMDWRLRRAWLRRLYREGRWADLLLDYRPTANTVTRCHYRIAQYRVGDREQALDAVADLWLAGRSQPDACDPLFDLWRDAGRLTPELAWQRIALAMEAGRPGLARYLARYLPEKERELAAFWRRVHARPSLVLEGPAAHRGHPRLEQVLAHGVRRWARRDPAAAAAAWDRLQRGMTFLPSQVAAVERRLGLARLGEEPELALAHLDRVPPEHADATVHQTRLRALLRLEDWEGLVTRFARLPAEERGDEDWTYWRGRALAALGKRAESRQVLEPLARERSYYGYLAADRLELPYQLNHEPLAVAPELLERLAADPVLDRVREFYALGRTIDARREWYSWTRDLADPELEAAAVLAHQRGWHFNTIFTLGQRRAFDDVERRFPLAFRDPVVNESRRNALDPAWVYAVVRQESAFEPTARSPAGALGLMQIMPNTAKMMARRLQARIEPRRDLVDAHTNLRLGSAYLRTLLERFAGNPVVATAAYNAGPRRVRHWLPDGESRPAELWIEDVPFRETRGYVKKVFFYTAIYEHRLGGTPTRLERRLKPVGGE